MNGLTRVAPTVQTFTTGSGTYITPTSPRSPLYLKVTVQGAGGGGAGSGTCGNSGMAGGTGGATSFGPLTAGGGTYGWNVGFGAAVGAGGTPAIAANSAYHVLVSASGNTGDHAALFTSNNWVAEGAAGQSPLSSYGSGGIGGWRHRILNHKLTWGMV